MATPLMLNISPNFNMVSFAEQLAATYRMQGYIVSIAYLPNSVVLKFDKGTGGINTLLGLGEGISATCSINNGMLYVTYSNEEWTGKIVGFAVGWFLCTIPLITAAVGTVKQLDLPKRISGDATRIAASFV